VKGLCSGDFSCPNPSPSLSDSMCNSKAWRYLQMSLDKRYHWTIRQSVYDDRTTPSPAESCLARSAVLYKPSKSLREPELLHC
jgi:hypothetical protein